MANQNWWCHLNECFKKLNLFKFSSWIRNAISRLNSLNVKLMQTFLVLFCNNGFLQYISLKSFNADRIQNRFLLLKFCGNFLGECWMQQSVPLGPHRDVRLQSRWRTNVASAGGSLLPGERVWWPLHRGDNVLLRSSRILADCGHSRHREACHAVC